MSDEKKEVKAAPEAAKAPVKPDVAKAPKAAPEAAKTPACAKVHTDGEKIAALMKYLGLSFKHDADRLLVVK